MNLYAATLPGALLLSAGMALGQPAIANLGVLPGGTYSIGASLSADGAVVAGTCGIASGERAFTWTAAGGMVNLGTLPGGSTSNGNAISADGSMVAGIANLSSGFFHAVRWTSGGIADLGVLPDGVESRAYGIRSDGLSVVGAGQTPEDDRAFITVNNVLVSLGVVPGGTFSRGFAISDNSVVVGACDEFPGSGGRAMRYSPASGVVSLGTIPPAAAGRTSVANDISGDGTVVVGSSGVAAGRYHAFRWTSAGGMQDLGLVPGTTDSFGDATNSDGTIIVGQAESGAGSVAFLWTATLGMVALNTYLPTVGVNLAGWTLRNAYDVSADGTAITGFGVYNGALRGWVVTGLSLGVPCYGNCDGSTVAPVLNVSDFTCFLNLYAAGDPRANCDGSTVPPVLNVSDFICFQSRFAAGCS